MVAVSKPQMKKLVNTAEDLAALSGNGRRYELLTGKLIELPPAGLLHGYYTSRLASRVDTYIDDHDLGAGFAAKTGFKIEVDPDTVVAPDWAFVVKARVPHPLPKGFAPLVPDLVLETWSPNDTVNEAKYKALVWLQAGVKEVWLLDPMERTLTIYGAADRAQSLGPDDTLDGGDLLPGFRYALSRLFPESAPDAGQ